jgi:hypothetical protein
MDERKDMEADRPSRPAGIRPFHCGSQFEDWHASNCAKCAKGADNAPSPRSVLQCSIEQSLLEACFGDGDVTAKIAERMSFPGTGHQIWQCGEFQPKE